LDSDLDLGCPLDVVETDESTGKAVVVVANEALLVVAAH
jgi:hypothetical protein